MKLCFIPRHSQITAIQVACSNGLPECVEMATKMFADWMNNNTNLYGHHWISIYYFEFEHHIPFKLPSEMNLNLYMITIGFPKKWSHCNSFNYVL